MVSISIKEKRKSAKYHLEALKHPEKGRDCIAMCRSRSQVRATNLQWPEFFEGAHDDEVRASESVLAITRCGGGNRRHCAQLSLLKFTQLEQQPLNCISCGRQSIKMKGDDFLKWVSSHLKYCKHSVERQQLQNTFPTYFLLLPLQSFSWLQIRLSSSSSLQENSNLTRSCLCAHRTWNGVTA